MANPNSADRDNARKSERKLRNQMGVENQTAAEGASPKVDPVGFKPPSNVEGFAVKLQNSLSKAASAYDKGELTIRAAWVAIGDALLTAKKPFINYDKKGDKGGQSVENKAYGEYVKAWVAEWSEQNKDAHYVLASNLTNANVRAAAIWLAERWDHPVLDEKSGEVVLPAAKDLKACRVQNNPVHCRQAYVNWQAAMDKVEKVDLDYIAPRATGNGESTGGGSKGGQTGAQMLKQLYEKLLREAQTALLNEKFKARHWEAEALRFKAERDDALAQLRSQSIPVNEPAEEVDYIDLTEADYTEVVCTQGVRNLKARDELAMPDLDKSIKLLTGPAKGNGKPKATIVHKAKKAAKGKAAKAKGEDAQDALAQKGKAAKAAKKAATKPASDDGMSPGPSEV